MFLPFYVWFEDTYNEQASDKTGHRCYPNPRKALEDMSPQILRVPIADHLRQGK